MTLRVRWATVLTVAVAALALVALLGAGRARAASGASAGARSCGWIIEPTANSQNILFPDTDTEYLAAVMPVPPGGYIDITGEFPHARYMSFESYSSTLQPTSDIHDSEIVPDAGSVNPFLPGAPRSKTNRSYTVRLVSGKPPAHPPANTLYDTSTSGQSGAGLAYRIYLPDEGTGEMGGVPAPTLAIVLASGEKITLPTCSAPPSDALLTSTLAGSGLAADVLPAAGLLATPTPTWHKYVNAPNGYAQLVTGGEHVPASVATEVSNLTDALPAGLGENVDNKYVFTDVSREFGEVVEFRMKVPTTPHTDAGESRMGTGQLRYWSVCTGTLGTQTLGCTVDEQTPLAAGRIATVVISTASDRPADATSACGVAWLPWGPAPDGIAMLRNMLPAASFSQAIQNATPGTEQKTMGAYYPTGRYFATPQAFDAAVGCH